MPDTPTFGRYAEIPYDQMTPEQQQGYRSVVEIRGQLSCGMLCSEAELGLSHDHSGLLILPTEAPLGEPVFAVLGLRDTILDVAVAPNRGDCLSVLGLAREIAALTDTPLRASKPRVQERGPAITAQARVTVADPDLCPRYAARVISRVQVAPSPAWMQWRLEAAGIRALNNLVDVTNYVMLERGQPLHAFDLASLAGAEIVVRRARDLAAITTLDGQTRTLVPEDLLICDRDRAVAIAGHGEYRYRRAVVSRWLDRAHGRRVCRVSLCCFAPVRSGIADPQRSPHGHRAACAGSGARQQHRLFPCQLYAGGHRADDYDPPLRYARLGLL